MPTRRAGLAVRFESDTTHFNRGLRNMSTSFNRFATSALKSSALIGGALAAGFAVAGRAAIKFSATSLRTFREYEESSTRVLALLPQRTKETTAEVDRILRNAARQTGIDFATVNNAAYSLVSGGFTETAALEDAINAVGKASVATGSNIESVSNAVAGLSNSFDLAASKVTNFVTASARLGILTLEELASTLPKVGEIASSIGLSLEQTGAAFSSITTSGINAAESATALNQLLVQAQKVGSSIDTAIREDFGSSFRELVAQGTDPIEIFRTLRANRTDDEFAGLQTEVRAGTALRALSGDTGFETYNNILNQVSNSQSEVASQFATVARTFSFASDRLRQTVATVRLELGERLGGALIDNVNELTGRFEELLTNDLFLTALDDFSENASDLFDALQDIDPQLVEFTRSFNNMIDGLGDFTRSAVPGIQSAVDDIADGFANLSVDVLSIAGDSGGDFGGLVEALGESFGNILDDFGDLLIAASGGFNVLVPIISTLAEVVEQTIRTFTAGLNTLNQALIGGLFAGTYIGRKVLTSGGNRIDAALNSTVNQRKGLFGSVLNRTDPTGARVGYHQNVIKETKNYQQSINKYNRFIKQQGRLEDFYTDMTKEGVTSDRPGFKDALVGRYEGLEKSIDKMGGRKGLDQRGIDLANRHSIDAISVGALKFNKEKGSDFLTRKTPRDRTITGLAGVGKGLNFLGNALGTIGLVGAAGTLATGLITRLLAGRKSNKQKIKEEIQPFISNFSDTFQESLTDRLDKSFRSSELDELLKGTGGAFGTLFTALGESSAENFNLAVENNVSLGTAIEDSLNQGEGDEIARLAELMAETFNERFEAGLDATDIFTKFGQAATEALEAAFDTLFERVGGQFTADQITREGQGSIFANNLPGAFNSEAGRYLFGSAADVAAGVKGRVTGYQSYDEKIPQLEEEVAQLKLREQSILDETPNTRLGEAYYYEQLSNVRGFIDTKENELQEALKARGQFYSSGVQFNTAQQYLSAFQGLEAGVNDETVDIRPFLERLGVIGSDGSITEDSITASTPLLDAIDNFSGADLIPSFKAYEEQLKKNTEATDALTDAVTENTMADSERNIYKTDVHISPDLTIDQIDTVGIGAR